MKNYLRLFSLLLLSCSLLFLSTGCGKKVDPPVENKAADLEPKPQPEPEPESEPIAASPSLPPLPELLGAWLMAETQVVTIASAADVLNVGKLSPEIAGKSYTLSAWINPTAFLDPQPNLLKITGGLLTIVGNGAQVNNGYFADGLPGFWTALNGDRLVHLMSDNQSANVAKGRVSTQSSIRLATNTWSHIIVEVDRSVQQVRFYINGELDPSTGDCSIVQTQTSLVPLTIGARSVKGSALFQGRIARVQVFSGLLDESQVDAFASEIPPTP